MRNSELVEIVLAWHFGELDRIQEPVQMRIEFKNLLIETPAHFKDRIGVHAH